MTLEEALGTYRGENETWQDVFDRINKTRGVDVKTLVNVIVCILEELYGEKEKPDPLFYREEGGIHTRVDKVEEEVPDRTRDEDNPKTNA